MGQLMSVTNRESNWYWKVQLRAVYLCNQNHPRFIIFHYKVSPSLPPALTRLCPVHSLHWSKDHLLSHRLSAFIANNSFYQSSKVATTDRMDNSIFSYTMGFPWTPSNLHNDWVFESVAGVDVWLALLLIVPPPPVSILSTPTIWLSENSNKNTNKISGRHSKNLTF